MLICFDLQKMVIQSDLTFGLGSFVSEKHPNNNKIYHLTPYNISITSEIDNIQYEIMNKFIHS